MTEVFGHNGKRILLQGVENDILVPSEKAKNIEIRPLGKCVVTLDKNFPTAMRCFLSVQNLCQQIQCLVL